MSLAIAKQKLFKKMVEKIKETKKKRWIWWIINKLHKKGILIDPLICAYGNPQIVGKVKKYGNGYIFWSKACGGCPIGEQLILDYKKKKKLPKDLPCVLLKNALISVTPVAEGEIVKLLPLELTR